MAFNELNFAEHFIIHRLSGILEYKRIAPKITQIITEKNSCKSVSICGKT
jgi:hypothetical protein